jgi:hypothetical protein
MIIGMLCMGMLSCSVNSSSKENTSETNAKMLKDNIVEMEDSLSRMAGSNISPTAYNLAHFELINRLESYYKSFPKDSYSAECLFKIHMLYSGLNSHMKSVAYGDTLLRAFPDYKNKHLLLESMASSFDLFITPRDTAAIRKYYNMLLSDNSYTKEKKQQIRMRLKFLHLTFMEYADKNRNSPLQ